MKLIIAIIQPNRLEAVKAALAEVEVFRLTVMDVQGFGRQRGYTKEEEPAEEVKFVEKLKLEIVVDEEMVENVIAILRKLAGSKTIGAGKIFVVPVEDAVRISTAESGDRAIH